MDTSDAATGYQDATALACTLHPTVDFSINRILEKPSKVQGQEEHTKQYPQGFV